MDDPAAGREREALQAALDGIARAMTTVPGRSPWADTLWQWGEQLERALAATCEPA